MKKNEYIDPMLESYMEDVEAEYFKETKDYELEELQKELWTLEEKEKDDRELLETIKAEIKENEKEIEEDKKIFKRVDERLKKIKEEKKQKEKNLEELKEKARLLTELDKELEGIVSPRRRREIYLNGLKHIKTGEEGKEQVLNIADKLVKQAKKKADYERNLFK